MTEEEFIVIEDTPDYYLVRNVEGKEIKLYKIDQEEVRRIHRASIEKLAKGLTREMVDSLTAELRNILSLGILLHEYPDIAKNLVDKLRDYYEKVGRPNLLHYYIKDIDPDVYGKGQTFLKEVESLLGLMDEVVDFMQEVES